MGLKARERTLLFYFNVLLCSPNNPLSWTFLTWFIYLSLIHLYTVGHKKHTKILLCLFTKRCVAYGEICHFLCSVISQTLIVKVIVENVVTCFYRAMHFSAKRGIAIACRLSVRLSVCL